MPSFGSIWHILGFRWHRKTEDHHESLEPFHSSKNTRAGAVLHQIQRRRKRSPTRTARDKPTRVFLTMTARLFGHEVDLNCLYVRKLLYFEWSPPWHVGWRLSGEGCHWEYDGKNGEFENIDFRFPWLSDTSEMGFGHDVPFLNYSDRLPHPSDLCQPDRVRWG